MHSSASLFTTHRETLPIAGRRFSASTLLILLAALIFASRAGAAPQGELDASFGQQGRLTFQIDSVRFGWAISQQPDGKLLFPGYHAPDGQSVQGFAVLRLNSDGSRDATFGTDGLVIVDYPDAPMQANRLAVQSDGKIIVAGAAFPSEGHPIFGLARLNANGTLDASYGTDGLALLEVAGNDSISDVVPLPGGGSVVAGISGGFSATFARFDANGVLDTTFGTGPVAGTTVVNVDGRMGEIFSLAVQPDGKFVACGAASDYSELVYIGDVLAIRVDANGSIDTTFGTQGISRTATGRAFSYGESCTAMPDGGLVVAGAHGEAGDVHPVLVRLLPDGTRDMGFGTSGIATFAVGHIDVLYGVLRLADGSLGVTGVTQPVPNTGEPLHLFVAHLDSEHGVLDSSFGDQGITVVDFGRNGQSSVVTGRGLIQQADGKLIAVGEDWNSSIALARVHGSGTGSAGLVGFVTTSAETAEGANLVINLQRTGGSVGALSVDFSTVAATATAPADFTEVSGTLTWQDGEMGTKSITVPITDDNDKEDSERFLILLAGSPGSLASDSISVQIDPSDAVPPRPTPAPSSSGGGGSVGIETLTLLALITALAARRRRTASSPLVSDFFRTP